MAATHAAAAAADETTLAREPRPTAVSAYGGFVVWSSKSSRDHRYRLMAWDRRQGRRVLRAPPRSVPFDADLGPDRHGRPVAVYSRCREEPTVADSKTDLPTYVNGLGCDLYRLDLAGGPERRLDKLSQRGASEVLPSIWGARVAFARTYERRPGLRGVLPHLLLGSPQSGRARNLPAGTRGVYENNDLGGPGPSERSYFGGPGPTGIDYDGRRVAFTWELQQDSCRPGDEGDLVHDQSELRIDTVTGGHRVVELSCEGETDYFSSPSLWRDQLTYFRRLNVTSPGGRFRAYDLHTDAFFESPDTPEARNALSISRGSDATYYSWAHRGRHVIVRDTALEPGSARRNDNP